jgi:hypothetical protein
MKDDIPTNDSQCNEYELSEYEKVVLRTVYEEVKGRDESIPEYQLYKALGEEFDPDTSTQNIITKTILNLEEKGLLANDITKGYSKKSSSVKNICLTPEGRKCMQKLGLVSTR